MYDKFEVTKIILDEEKRKNHYKTTEKILDKCKKNIITNLSDYSFFDLNNLGTITFLTTEKLKNNSYLKGIFYTKDAYNIINTLKPYEISDFLINLFSNIKEENIKITYKNKILQIEKLNNSLSFLNIKNKVESLLFETKQTLKYLNSISVKISKINDFITYTYQNYLVSFPAKQLEHIKEYVEYIESDFKLTKTKEMIKYLGKYKIWKNPWNIKEIVLEWSFELIYILNQHSNQVIENFHKEVKKKFIV